MTVPAVAAPIENPPRAEAPEEESSEAGVFAAMLSREAAASNEEEPETSTEGEEVLAMFDVEPPPEVAEQDAEISQLLASVLGDPLKPAPGGTAGPVATAPAADAEALSTPTPPSATDQPRLPAAPVAIEATAKSLPGEPATPPVTPELPPAPAAAEAPIERSTAAGVEVPLRPAQAVPVEVGRPAEAPSQPPTQTSLSEVAVQGAQSGRSGLDQGGAEDPGRQGSTEAGRAAQAAAAEETRQATRPDRFAELLATPQNSSDASEAQPTTTPAAPPPISIPQAPGITPALPATTTPPVGAPAEVVPVHVEWLAARGGGSARLRLDPPNLGEVEVAVTVRGSAVDVVIRAADPAAQIAVAQTRELLVDGLAARELRIDSFEVRGAAAENLGDRESDQSPRDPATATGDQGDRDDTGTPEGELGSESPLARKGTEQARPAPPISMIQTGSGDSGVDLHI